MTTGRTPRSSRSLRIPILLLLLTAVGFGAEAQSEPAAEAGEQRRDAAALELLEKVDAKTKSVERVRYRGLTEATGAATQFMPERIEGQIVADGWAGNQPQRFFGTLTVPGTEDGSWKKVTGGGNGDMFFVVDHEDKKAYEDMDPGVIGSYGQYFGNFGMLEFLHPTPFSDELNADVVEMRGTQTIGGVECQEVYVEYSQNRGTSKWCFSTEDHLPRQRVRYIEAGLGNQGEIVITISELDVEPEITDATFRLDLPEGYEQIDDFAP
ncbi:MAG: hypothetical protein AAGN46_11105 [Acidobacteriota bacterium]